MVVGDEHANAVLIHHLRALNMALHRLQPLSSEHQIRTAGFTLASAGSPEA